MFVYPEDVSTAKRVAELEQERASLRTSLELTMARLSDVEHELKVLRTAAQNGGELAGMMLTDAIVAVLRKFDGAAAPSDIHNALESAGVIVEHNKVTATVSHLVKQNRITKLGRAQYLAV